MGFPNTPVQQPSSLQEDLQGAENPIAQSSTGDTYSARFAQAFTNTPIADAVYGVEGMVKDRDGSPMLTKEAAMSKYGGNGVDFDGPVSEDYAQFKASQAYKQNQWADVLNRGGSQGAANTWLGYGTTQAAALLDPIQDAVALVPFAKMAGLAGKFGDSVAAGLTEHAISGTVNNGAFSLAQEPFNYANDPKDWTVEGAAERLLQNSLFGAVAGPLLHTTAALTGTTGEFLSKSLTNSGDLASSQQAGFWDSFISRLQPETRVALAKASLGRSVAGQEDLSPVEALVGLDQRISAHEAELGGVQLPMEERAEVLRQMDAGTYTSPRQAIADSIAQRLTDEEVGATANKLQEPQINAAVQSMQEMGRQIGASDRFTPEEKAGHIANVNDFIGKVNDYLGSQQHFPLDPATTIQDVPKTGPGNMPALAANLHPAVDTVMDGLDEYKNLQQHKAERVIKENPQSVKQTPVKAPPTEKQLLANPRNTKLRAIKSGVNALQAAGNSPELKAGLQAYKNELARLQLPEQPVTQRDLVTSRVNDIRDQMQQEQKAQQNPPRMQFGKSTDFPAENLGKQAQEIQDRLAEIEKRPAPTEEEPNPLTESEKIVQRDQDLQQAHHEAISCVTNTL